MSLFEKLKSDARDEWVAYIDHEFVQQMGNGTLPTSCFQHYLKQDFLFLKQFARAYALAVYKSSELKYMKDNLATLSAIINTEMGLHIKLCKNWGIDESELEAEPEANQTVAYTRFVLEEGMRGDLLDLKVALSPCVIGYGEIGKKLISNLKNSISNDYRCWIEEYGGLEYQGLAESAVSELDNLAKTLLTENRYPQLLSIFKSATNLETDFWQMGLDFTS